MSRVVIIAVGSRGDVAPLTGVGVALQQAGHEVAIVAYTPFADMIANCKPWVIGAAQAIRSMVCAAPCGPAYPC
jgi:UDP:flavonoid glycosyltransferase YjiC (YdhE family)